MKASIKGIAAALIAFSIAPVIAAPVIFSGLDAGAVVGDPRGVSNSVAGYFDTAASILGPEHLINFESAPVGLFSSLVIAPGVTLTGAALAIDNAPSGTPSRLFGFNTTTGGSKFVSDLGQNLTFSFAAPVDAFGAYFTGVQFTNEMITFLDGTSESIAIPGYVTGGVGFLGFTDAGKSVSNITLHVTGGDIIGVDDVRYVNTAPVPEPSTYALLVAGLGAFWLAAKRRRLPRRPQPAGGR